MSNNTVNGEMQVVAFCLKDEEFAIDIQQLREVLKYVDITPLPQSAEFIEGVLNLRGDVIPVIDLSKRFGIEKNLAEVQTRIIIVEIDNNMLGLIVDQVSEVLHFSAQEVQPPPKGMLGANNDFIKGIGKKGDRLILILKPDKIVTTEEKIELEQLIQENVSGEAS